MGNHFQYLSAQCMVHSHFGSAESHGTRDRQRSLSSLTVSVTLSIHCMSWQHSKFI